MDIESAKIIAAAMHSMAAATAIQAETNAVLAGEVNKLRRTVQGAQAKIDRNVGPLIERSKAAVHTVMLSLEEVQANADPGA